MFAKRLETTKCILLPLGPAPEVVQVKLKLEIHLFFPVGELSPGPSPVVYYIFKQHCKIYPYSVCALVRCSVALLLFPLTLCKAISVC